MSAGSAPAERGAPRPAAVRARGLGRRYGRQLALREVNLEVPLGQCVAILGPNGAGKSTLLRLLAGLAAPSWGEVELMGTAVHRGPPAALKGQMGYLGHQSLLYAELSGRENLSFYGRLYRVPRLEERIAQLAAQLELEPVLPLPVRACSRGMQQRLALARALLHRPRLLLLDEPHTGLDEDGRARLDGLLAGMKAQGCTILLSTHSSQWGAGLWDRALLLVAGSLVADLSGADVSQRVGRAWQEHARRRERAPAAAQPVEEPLPGGAG